LLRPNLASAEPGHGLEADVDSDNDWGDKIILSCRGRNALIAGFSRPILKFRKRG
jgi:hypothetical protein